MRLVVSIAQRETSEELPAMLEASPALESIEPLAVAPRMRLGKEVKAPVEVVEVAKDLLKRIEAGAR